MRKLSDMPFYPLLPFAPIFLVGGVLLLEIITLAGLRRINRRIDAIVAGRIDMATR